MSPQELAAIVARDAAPLTRPGEADLDRMWAAESDRRALLALLRETREVLGWTLRNSGGECPADYPAGYAKALRLAIRLATLGK